jgi:DGQHR domain-containing protein
MTPTTRGRRHLASTSRRAKELRLPALEVRQGPTRTVYSFAVDGKKLPLFATVSRIHRDDEAAIQGYQRPEVLSHIASIRRYLESDEPMIPNALVVAFDKRVVFEPDRSNGRRPEVRTGTLVIPVDPDTPQEALPGWIVDGQQRYAAIREAQIASFPICVTAFITDSDAEQRSQFILVNATKPLPKGLIHELLPSTTGTLPVALEIRRFPAKVLDRLNYDDDSPLNGMIHTPTTPNGVIKDNSILKMIENSLTDGALYRFRDPTTGSGDIDAVLGVLKDFWTAVEGAFPGAWKKPPRHSRLMHGVGVVSMGFVMDAIVEHYQRIPSLMEFTNQLTLLGDLCHWTDGTWQFGPGQQRRWNDLQNTPHDIQLLTDYLLAQYRAKAGGQKRQAIPSNRRGKSAKLPSGG